MRSCELPLKRQILPSKNLLLNSTYWKVSTGKELKPTQKTNKTKQNETKPKTFNLNKTKKPKKKLNSLVVVFFLFSSFLPIKKSLSSFCSNV